MSVIKTQLTVVSIETALATTKPLTGATQASECIITATAHGYADGSIIKILNAGGMFQINNRAFVVDLQAGSPITNKFGLKGVDSTNYLPYTSLGDSYKATMTAIGGITGIPTLFAGTSPLIDITSLTSLAKEKAVGLQDFGSTTLDMIFDGADAGQIAMQNAKELQIPKVFTVKNPVPQTAAFVAYVASFNVTAAGNEVYRATAELAIIAAPSKFA
jgi:hypothetical protein